jgi:hypothetical protein
MRDFLGVKRVRGGKRAITLCYRAPPLERLWHGRNVRLCVVIRVL